MFAGEQLTPPGLGTTAASCLAVALAVSITGFGVPWRLGEENGEKINRDLVTTHYPTHKVPLLSRFYGGFDILFIFIIPRCYSYCTRRVGGGFLRRGRFEIIGEILSLAQDGARKTTIVYRANLNFNVVNRYLRLLVQEGLISPVDGSERKLKTTEQGLLFLDAYKTLMGVAKNL